MYYSFTLAALLVASASAHGVITEIQGANGVNMPGLTIIDGTPRDCSSNRCGSQADTAIIRTREMSTDRASALGRTQGGGPVDAAAMVSTFMGGATKARRGLLDNILGGAGGGNATSGGAGGAGGLLSGITGGGGTKATAGAVEDRVESMAGAGAESGLPTCSDDGEVTMTFHQVNQDGAGPLTAQIDATSGGTDASAFEDAEVTQNVPGLAGQISTATATDFPVTVQMPAGTVCSGTVAGVENVCVVRMQNSAIAGPFGGSAAFTQSNQAKRRAVEYNLRKRHMARGILRK